MSSSPLIVMFYTASCGACRFAKPTFEAESRTRTAILDVRDASEVIDRFNLFAVPTFVAFDEDGVEKERYVGANKDALKDFLQRN